MKSMRFILLLLLINIGFKSFAEYNKCDLEVTITLVDNSKINLFLVFPVWLHPDSINSLESLKKSSQEIGGNLIFNEENRLIGFKKRYMCCDEYVYFFDISITLDSIKALKVESISNGTSMRGIASDIVLSDTIWFEEKPIKKIKLNGGHAEYTIFTFERKRELKRLIDSFKSVYQKWSLTNELSDEELMSIVKKMNDYKVVVTYFGGGC